MAEIDPDFYSTGAMTNSEWKGICRENRHTAVRYSVHGFHHMLCRTAGRHEPRESCRCKYCNLLCAKYRGNECQAVASLTRLALTL